jgi:hypothetical protein
VLAQIAMICVTGMEYDFENPHLSTWSALDGPVKALGLPMSSHLSSGTILVSTHTRESSD